MTRDEKMILVGLLTRSGRSYRHGDRALSRLVKKKLVEIQRLRYSSTRNYNRTILTEAGLREAVRVSLEYEKPVSARWYHRGSNQKKPYSRLNHDSDMYGCSVYGK